MKMPTVCQILKKFRKFLPPRQYKPVSPFQLGLCAWFTATVFSFFIGMHIEDSNFNIALGIGSFSLGLLAFFYWSVFSLKLSTEWVVDSFQKTFTFSDIQARLGAITVPIDRLEGFYWAQSRSQFGEFYEKRIYREISTLKNELYVRFYDEHDDLQTVKLASNRVQWGSFEEEYKAWLERECLTLKGHTYSHPEHRS
jgi:hypothetical protein